MNRLIASLTGGGLGSSKPSEILPLQPIVYGSEEFIKRKFLDARPYPNTSLEIRFPDGTIKKGITKLDLEGESGKDNMLVEYTDNTEQRFTSKDGEIEVKFGRVKAHYRGGRKRNKTRRNKTRRNKTRRNKTRRNKKSRKSRKI